MKQELVKPIVRVGNSAGVLLPREWLNGRARVELVEKPTDIKRDVLEILEDYLEDVAGIYLVGSYARNEQTDKSDIDILVISNDTAKEIVSGKYNVSIARLESIKNMLKSYPVMIYPRLLEAKPILNSRLLKELLSCNITKNSFKESIASIKRVVKINRDFIRLDKDMGEKYSSDSTVYSLTLRLREIFLIKMIMEKKPYSSKKFKKWVEKNTKDINFDKIYDIYQAVKMNHRIQSRAEVLEAEQLLKLLENEMKKYGK